MLAWPATVTLKTEGDYRESPEPGVDGFQPDIGPPLNSVTMLVPTWLINVTIRCETQEEYEALRNFYEQTTKWGTLHFTRRHPRTMQEEREFQIVSFELGQVMTTGKKANGDIVQLHYVSMVLRYFPGVS